MPKNKYIKFLPSYVGAKTRWIDALKQYKGRNFVEIFCGSGVISANLASTCVLNDIDNYIYKIFSNYNDLIVPEVFTPEDYFKYRTQENWWQYVYCLQKMSFSGVFRYSKNGFNVPIKTNKPISVANEYHKSLIRWNQLSPIVLNRQYYNLNEFIHPNSVLIIDPPYEKAQASYNKSFDYHYYWEYIRLNENICKDIVVFDYEYNLPFDSMTNKNIRVNGAKRGDKEGVFIFENSLKEGAKGEELFLKYAQNFVKKTDGRNGDFLMHNGAKIELKSDYYNPIKTENFFIERYSRHHDKSPGGPWQAHKNDCKYYVYMFVKTKECFIFDTNQLVIVLDDIINRSKITPIFIPNKGYVTSGYKIKRESLAGLFTKRTLDEIKSGMWQ